MISAHLPKPARTGRPRADDRRAADAMLYVCVTGCRWIDLPERYGSKSTAHKRLQDWRGAGVWKGIPAAAVKAAHEGEGRRQVRAISAGSPSVPAKKGRPHRIRRVQARIWHEAARRSGFCRDAGCNRDRPADGRGSARLIGTIGDVRGTMGRAAPGMRPARADRGYDTELIRDCLGAGGMRDCMPYRAIGARRAAGNRGDTVRYAVERFFSWPKNGFHRLRIRYGRKSGNCPAFANIASFMMYLRVFG